VKEKGREREREKEREEQKILKDGRREGEEGARV
jgi:hypothetical protein